MTGHRAVIEAGPGTIRRLCCGAEETVDGEVAAAALDGIDDRVVLLDEQPVAVAALWRTLLQPLTCPDRQPEAALVVHPSWWSESRVALVTAAAGAWSDDVSTWPRSRLLVPATPDARTTVVVEIAARLVAITGGATVAEPRTGPPHRVADAVVRRVVALTRGAASAILIDGPTGVGGAPALAAMIADRVRVVLAGTRVELVDETRFAAAVRQLRAERTDPAPAPADGGRRRHRGATLVASMALLAVAALGVGSRIRHDAPAAAAAPSTFLVEGRMALRVPAGWLVQRVTGGPGSARVEVISPSDPQVILHVTQSVVPGENLTGAAESLREAMDRANAAGPQGVFVDFDPSGHSAGRPAVTYREVRAGHHIDWAVLVDGAVRISIGCQSGADGDSVRAVCEQAVRSAHALS